MHRLRSHRASRRALGLTIAALSALGVVAGTASASTGLGGQLFSTGGTVEVTVLPAAAGFTSSLFLRNPDGTDGPVIATNRQVGTHVTLGPFPAGQELVFGIHVEDGHTYLMGPASRNPDNVVHANVTEVVSVERTFDVGFEDLFGGGDRDYNDNVFRFTGNLAPNRPPSADDQSVSTDEDTAKSITLTASDPDGDSVTYTHGSPAHGTLTGSGANLTYTPDADYNGADSFTFTADDGNGATDEGTVSITVNPVNDPPVARDDDAATDENDPVTVPVTANDSDVDGGSLAVTKLTDPAHGTATCTATACTYRPVSNFAGTDSFTYKACDGGGLCDEATVTITVRRVGKAGSLTGGAFTLGDDGKTQHQVQMGCTAAQGGRLTVKGKTGTFELRQVDYAICVDDPAISATPPDAGWDTHRGSGTGTFNGAPGYTVEWKLTDAGEPGSADSASITVRSPSGAVVLSEGGLLVGGNHQAHAA